MTLFHLNKLVLYFKDWLNSADEKTKKFGHNFFKAYYELLKTMDTKTGSDSLLDSSKNTITAEDIEVLTRFKELINFYIED